MKDDWKLLPEVASRQMMWYKHDDPIVIWDEHGLAWSVGTVRKNI